MHTGFVLLAAGEFVTGLVVVACGPTGWLQWHVLAGHWGIGCISPWSVEFSLLCHAGSVHALF